MNPYAIIVAIVIAAGLWFGGHYSGYQAGVSTQKVADQKQFDKINSDISKQKDEANKMLQDALTANLSLQSERDKFKTQLEKDHATYTASITDLRNKYSSTSLRYRALKDTVCRPGGSGTPTPSTDAPVPSATAIVQLPDALAARLRQRAFDADYWVGWYHTCYAYAVKGH